jgi:hypothetical protein
MRAFAGSKPLDLKDPLPYRFTSYLTPARTLAPYLRGWWQCVVGIGSGQTSTLIRRLISMLALSRELRRPYLHFLLYMFFYQFVVIMA